MGHYGLIVKREPPNDDFVVHRFLKSFSAHYYRATFVTYNFHLPPTNYKNTSSVYEKSCLIFLSCSLNFNSNVLYWRLDKQPSNEGGRNLQKWGKAVSQHFTSVKSKPLRNLKCFSAEGIYVE